MKPSNPIAYINSDTKLQSICKEFSNSNWLAIDTEFLREKTYYPKFCLLQIANTDRVACIDPIVLTDLEPLFTLIYDPSITKIFHAGRQDLEIFHNLRKALPKPIFDTQIAAPLLGYSEQMGYASLVFEMLGVSLGKAHTRTDWSQRPLSREQLRYASDDVVYLAQIYPKMQKKLASLNRLEWLTDDFHELTQPELYLNPPDQAWRRIRGAKKLSLPALTVLKDLAKWREIVASEENLPRNWVIKDDALINLARMQPADQNQLKSLRGIHERSIRKYGDSFLDIIASSKEKSVEAIIPGDKIPKKTAQQDALIKFLMGIIHQRAIEHSLNPGVLAPKKDLERLVFGSGDSRILQGWRKKIVGLELSAILRGEQSITIEDGILKMTRNKSIPIPQAD